MKSDSIIYNSFLHNIILLMFKMFKFISSLQGKIFRIPKISLTMINNALIKDKTNSICTKSLTL